MKAARGFLRQVVGAFAALASIAGCGHLVATIERPLGQAKLSPAEVAIASAQQGPMQTFKSFAPASLRVHPAGLSASSGSRHRVAVEARDALGDVLSAGPVLVSLTPLILRVGADGTIETLAPGRGELAVSAGGAAAIMVVDVTGPLPARAPGELRIAGPRAMRVDMLGALPTALTLEADGTGTPTWVSSAPAVATVDAQGRVTVVGNGTATIHAELGGARSPDFTLTARQRPYLLTAVGPGGGGALRLAKDETATVAATLLDGNRNAVPVDGWRVDSPSVATVSAAGLIRGTGLGSTLVRPIAGRLAAPDRGAIALGVGQAPATPALGTGGLAVEPGRFTLPVGGHQALQARVRDGDGTVIQPPLTYVAEPAGVVQVDGAGLVTAIAPGQANVKVEGFGTSRNVPVTVVAAAPDAGLAIDGPASLMFTSLGPIGTPLAKAPPGTRWETADAGVVTVDDQGRLTAVADGRTTVTAVQGATRTGVAVEVDQRPAFLAVHGTLPGDPREVTAHGTEVALAFSGTAFDFNGNPMPVDRIVSDDEKVVFAGQRDVLIRDGGSAYVRAVSKGVRSSNANSVLIQSAAGATAVASSDGTGQVPTASPSPRGPDDLTLAVTPAAVGLTVGGQLRLGITVRDAQGTGVAVDPDYTTDDPAIATVSANGTITGVGVGTATIRVSVRGDRVDVPVTITLAGNPNLVVNPVSLTAAAFGVIGTPLVATTNQGAVAWSTDNGAVATVDAAGNVTAVGNGTANIIATAGAETTQVPVTVDQRASSVRVDSDEPGNPRSITLLTGETAQLGVTASDANGNAMAALGFEVAAGDAGIISVNGSGVLTAVGAGTAYVRVTTRGPVTSDDGESIRVTVEARDLDVSPGSLAFGALEATQALSGTSNQGAIAWSTDDAAVATVDTSGVVTSHADGTATITATSGTSSFDVTVTVAQRASTVLVSSGLVGDPRNIVFNRLGDTLTLTATATDANNQAVPQIGWESSDPSVVSVDANGLVTILADGEAYIRVITNGSVSSTDAQSILFTVDVNNAGSVDATINLP